MKVRVQVDTVGRVAVSLKHILGREPGKPKGWTSAQPVRKIKTSLSVGVSGGLSAITIIK